MWRLVALVVGSAVVFGFLVQRSTGEEYNFVVRCSNFAHQLDAQHYFDDGFPGHERLDGDGDMIACESLP